MSTLRRAERVLFWVAAILVVFCCLTFLFLVFTRPADAAELVLPTEPEPESDWKAEVNLTIAPEVLGTSMTPTPEPTPVPTPEPPTPKPVVLAGGSIQARIAAAWPGDDRKVLCIVNKETGGTFNPAIKNPSGKYWGLFQADAAFRAAYGWGPSVEEQTAMAWRGFQARGWSPWPTAQGCG